MQKLIHRSTSFLALKLHKESTNWETKTSIIQDHPFYITSEVSLNFTTTAMPRHKKYSLKQATQLQFY